MLIKAKVLAVESFSYTSKKTGEIGTGATMFVNIQGDPISYRIAVFGKQVEKIKTLKVGEDIDLAIRPDRNLNPEITLA